MAHSESGNPGLGMVERDFKRAVRTAEHLIGLSVNADDSSCQGFPLRIVGTAHRADQPLLTDNVLGLNGANSEEKQKDGYEIFHRLNSLE